MRVHVKYDMWRLETQYENHIPQITERKLST